MEKTNNYIGALIFGILFAIPSTYNILYSIFNDLSFERIGSNMISFIFAWGIIFYSIFKILKFKNKKKDI